ncbi:MAG: TOBE domain-containing protein [Geobacter sp.]|nr:TOBE domain-containing protein [Geobacter sp.]
MGKAQTVELDGSLWFNRAESKFLGGDRITLLEKIDELGSITRAAKAVGISYKTAWETVNQINNLAAAPLVDRATGGKGGGGASLTAAGREVLEQFRVVQDEHRKFLRNLDQRLGDTGSLYQFLRRISMKVSARNVFNGTVASITKGAVNAEVSLALKGDTTVTAVVTNGAIDNLGLKEGMAAYAIVKASSVVIGTDLAGAKLSTRNLLTGTIVKLVEGPVSCEVDLELPGGNTISAVITDGSAKRLGLKVGGTATALFKASSVILGVS